MYIITLLEGSIILAVRKLTPENLVEANDGYIDIIDITNPECSKVYVNGEWEDIEITEYTSTETND